MVEVVFENFVNYLRSGNTDKLNIISFQQNQQHKINLSTQLIFYRILTKTVVQLIIVKLLLTEIPTTPPFFQTELILLLQINTLLIVQFTAYSSPIIVPTAHTEYESLRIVFRVEITSVIYESKHNGVKNPTIPTACMYEACNVNVTQEDNMINLPAKQPIKPYQSNLLNESMFYQIHIFYSYNVFQEITPQPNNRPEYRIYQVVQV
ncbi:Hypothetical_protein [Hexamita inflata]|uniref:Hypothetical_protein n=1 Tax=Hexamita inflata TaxID=28002 RepID=A0AA86QTA4_9EUKA|nr:Hypothetical protein HINF_LOCUS46494 [Hexamita inflata]